MIVYLDTSVVLRVLLREANPVPGWGRWQHALSSMLLRIEGFRALERLHLTERLDDAQFVEAIAEFKRMLSSFSLLSLTDEILIRAEGSFTTPIGALDAIHLCTALKFSESGIAAEFAFLTHDSQLARAARAAHFYVQGA